MPSATNHLPEPLQSFRDVADAVSSELRAGEAARARYRVERDVGWILANSVEALRVELTYHSNAIEGSALSLRETQLVLEGYARPAGKPCSRFTRPETTTGLRRSTTGSWIARR